MAGKIISIYTSVSLVRATNFFHLNTKPKEQITLKSASVPIYWNALPLLIFANAYNVQFNKVQSKQISFLTLTSRTYFPCTTEYLSFI